MWATHLRRCFKGVDTVLDESISLHWLRVFGDAEASRMGQGVWQPRHTSAARSEKGEDSVAAEGMGMRVIAMFFGPCASDALTSHVSFLSYNFKMLERFTKLATSSFIKKHKPRVSL